MQEHAIRALNFIDAVVHQQTHLSRTEKPFDAAITHSVLDCVPRLLIAPIPLLEQQHLKLRAARLFLGLINAANIRLAVKVAQVMLVHRQCYCNCCLYCHLIACLHDLSVACAATS